MTKVIKKISDGEYGELTIEVGKTYMFYDDGKIRPSRQYEATVLRIIKVEDSKNIMFPTYCCEESDYYEETIVYPGEKAVGERSLYNIWLEAKKSHDWLFAEETDYFIECSIPRYDENNIWFVRTIEGNWFSLDIQSWWQGGSLDVSGELTRELKIALEEYNEMFGHESK